MSRYYPWNEADIEETLSELTDGTPNAACFATVVKICSCPPALLRGEELFALTAKEFAKFCGEQAISRVYSVPYGPAACFVLLAPSSPGRKRSYMRLFVSGVQINLHKLYGIVSSAAISRPLYEAHPANALLSDTMNLANASDLFALDGQPRTVRDFPRETPFTLPAFPSLLSECSSVESIDELRILVNDALLTVRIRSYMTLSESIRWLDTLIENINRLVSSMLPEEFLIPETGFDRIKWYNYSTFEEFCLQNRRLLDYPADALRELNAIC